EDRTLDVYVQVNTSGEASKFGLSPTDTHDFVSRLPQFDRLNVVGLMTLASSAPIISGCAAVFNCCAICATESVQKHQVAWCHRACRWVCPATTKSRSPKAPPQSVSAKPFSV